MSNVAARVWVGVSLLLASASWAQSTYQGRTAEEWIARLEENGPAASDALVALGPEAVPAIQARLADRKVCSRLLGVLVRLGPSARDAATAVVACLGDDDWRVRAEACMALGRIRASSPEVIAALSSMLSDDAGVRSHAVEALGRFGPAAASAAPALAQMIDSGSCASAAAEPYSERGMDLFARLGEGAACVAAELALALSEQEDAARKGAALLAASPPATRRVEADLWLALTHWEPEVRIDSARALLRIGAPRERLIPHLLRDLRLGRPRAARALGEIGAGAARGPQSGARDSAKSMQQSTL